MRKCLKSRKHTFKNLYSLVQSLTDKPINDKLLVFSDKIVFVWISSQKPRVSKARGSPLGRLMPDPREWQCVQMPRSCPGGGMGAAGIDWCITGFWTTGPRTFQDFQDPYEPCVLEGHLTDQSGTRVGHLNSVMTHGTGIWTSQSSKVQMPGGGMLKFHA